MTASAEGAGRRLPRLHLVTNDAVLRDPGFIETAARVLELADERVALHVRGHGLTGRDLWERAAALADPARAAGATLIVNDRVDVAVGCGAGGVQLGGGSLPPRLARPLLGVGAWIGASVHDRDDAARAVKDGADFLLAGTLFASPSHPGGRPAGLDWLPGVVRLGRPVVGIGGIDARRVGPVLATGAYGVAVISAVWSAIDPPAAVQRLLDELE